MVCVCVCVCATELLYFILQIESWALHPILLCQNSVVSDDHCKNNY
jgi:hypothetical protein